MNNRKASVADLEEISGLLNASNLPVDDIADHIDKYIVYEEKETIIGVGGLEVCGTTGLVRSIAVSAEYQNTGIGKKIYKLIELEASRLGLKALYLLTESATGYFIKLGFKVKERKHTPASIINTKQYQSICPSTATLMFRDLSDPVI